MPIYEYQCKACGGVQELMQKLSDPAPSECPACHQGPLVKLLSRTAFILKGNGWYVTDFRDKGKTAGGEAKAGGTSGPSKDEAAAASAATPAPSAAPAKEPAAAAPPATPSSTGST